VKLHYVIVAALWLSACTTTPEPPVAKERPEFGVLWVAHAAEYQAVSRQIYAQAQRDLPRLLADTDWSALPGQDALAGKPPAVIFDVDETVVSNADYQATLAIEPYTRWRHFSWMRGHRAAPVPGATAMVEAARDAGVAVFFVTNRACERFDGVDGDCPYEQVTIEDLAEVGIDTDPEHVLMAWERPGWDKEKLSRREFVAESYRVIMLFGDDFGDFVACTRVKPLPPCTQPATRASRHAALETYAGYWGNGWYILPNPMHGSWTTVR
jgi:5'-nucleotidase (lipoprotein e(P4) family)